MNVCLLTKRFSFNGTGPSRVAFEILKGLEKRGYTIHKIEAKPNVTLYSYFIYTAIGIPLRLPRKGIDVYHALVPLEGMWLPRNHSIVMIHDLFPTTNPDRVGAGMGRSKWKLAIGERYFSFGTKLASKCRFIVCNSDKTKQDVMEYLRVPEEKIRVIRLGISSDLEPKPKKDRVFRIGTLSQLDKRKRIDLLIKHFKGSKIDGELVIGGHGIDESILIHLANGDSRIKFLGFVPDDKLADFYNSLDVFVFPTGIEGYGLPMVEAMACKKPVVVLPDAIIPEEIKSRCIITENLGTLFSSHNYLENLCKSTDHDGNYQFAKEHNWDECVEEHIELYQEVVG